MPPQPINETLPVDWRVSPDWLPSAGAIHLYFVFPNGTRIDITRWASIIVMTGTPQRLSLWLANVTAAVGQPLLPGDSVLLSAKCAYSPKGPLQIFLSYPRTFSMAGSIQTWNKPNLQGLGTVGQVSQSFIAYARVNR